MTSVYQQARDAFNAWLENGRKMPTEAKPVSIAVPVEKKQSARMEQPKPKKVEVPKRPVVRRVSKNGKTEIIEMKDQVFNDQQKKLSSMPIEFQGTMRGGFDVLGIDMTRLPANRLDSMEQLIQIAQEETKSSDPSKILNWIKTMRTKFGIGYGAERPESSLLRLVRMR